MDMLNNTSKGSVFLLVSTILIESVSMSVSTMVSGNVIISGVSVSECI